MKTPHHGSIREPHSGEVWLEKLRHDNPDMTFIDGVADISLIADRQLAVRYGAASRTPLAYHNRLHGRDVPERAQKLLRIHHRVSPHSFDMARAPSLLAATGQLHDIVQLRGAVTNERLSADYARRIMPNYGFTFDEAELGADMIMATVTQLVDGKLRQTKLDETESHDPLCLILATADINGIAMEGLYRMVKDSINLTAEQHRIDPARVILEKPHDVAKLLSTQAQFFGNRLDQVGHDLRLFYTEDEAREIQHLYKGEFGSLGSEAIRAAHIFSRTPELLSDILPGNTLATVDVATSAILARVRSVLPQRHSNESPDDTAQSQPLR